MPTKIKAGQLRHKIEIQAQSETRDAGGGMTLVWTKIANSSGDANEWASIEPLSGSELIRGMQLQSPVTHRITIRYRKDLSYLTQYKVVHGSRIFNIKALRNLGERNRYIEMLAEEGTAVQ